jgi:hypothetical protein
MAMGARLGGRWAAILAAAFAAWPGAAAAAAATGGTPTLWHVAVNGQALDAPAPAFGGQVLLPVGALAKALDAVVVAVGGGAIDLAARAGPPQPYLASPAAVLLAPADLGPGYARATPPPDRAPAPLPGDAPARLAAASVVYTILPPARLRGLPPSVALGPAEIAVTVAEYASDAAAAQALAGIEASMDGAGAGAGPSAAGAAWPQVPGPYTPAQVVAPLGAASAVWSAAGGRIWLVSARTANWVVTSAVGGVGANVAWTLWLEQLDRVAAIPRPLPPAGVGPAAAAVALPAADQGALTVRLDGVPLGTAVWTASGYALPADAAAQALGLSLVRTGRLSLNLQGPDLVDAGATPAVVAPPATLALSPAAVWGITYRPVLNRSASNAAIEAATPSAAFAVADLGRLGSYAIEYRATPAAAAAAGAPQVVALSLVEYSTAAGAYQAVRTEAGVLGRIQAGAQPLALGDLNGARGLGPVTAVTAVVNGRHGARTRDDWLLLQVDNWEVLIGAANPDGTFTVRTLWPYLAAVTRNLLLAGQAAP